MILEAIDSLVIEKKISFGSPWRSTEKDFPIPLRIISLLSLSRSTSRVIPIGLVKMHCCKPEFLVDDKVERNLIAVYLT